MKIAYLQCHAGISGDMFLSGLLDAGLSQEKLRKMLESVDVSEQELVISKTVKKGITATTLEVIPETERDHLHVSDIRNIIKNSGLKPVVVERALAAFERIVKAESLVHGMPYDHVHLHEVSGLDTIVDLLGVSWGLSELGIEKVVATPVNVGSGTVKISHGVVPVPAPATAILLKDIPIVNDGLPGERTTPTGAALAAEFIDSFDAPGEFLTLSTGYGAGKLDSGDRANVLRITIGETRDKDSNESHLIEEDLVMLETDIDDDTPEILGYIMQILTEIKGVLDVSIIPTLRKKNRPGNLLRVLVHEDMIPLARNIILKETSTLGVRELAVKRCCIPRTVKTVATPWGNVRVTVASDTISPEFEDCRKIAQENTIPLKKVYQAALCGFVSCEKENRS